MRNPGTHRGRGLRVAATGDRRAGRVVRGISGRQHHHAAQAQSGGERAPRYACQAGQGTGGRDGRGDDAAARARRPRVEGRMGCAPGDLPADRDRAADRDRPAQRAASQCGGHAPQLRARRLLGQREDAGAAGSRARCAAGAGAAAAGHGQRNGCGRHRRPRAGRDGAPRRAGGTRPGGRARHRRMRRHDRPGGPPCPRRAGSRGSAVAMMLGSRARIELPDRMELAALPTPLVTAPRLAAVLGLECLYVKRDDLTGFAIGGNKARPLEFLIAAAIRQGADTLVTGGAAGSNFCVAAAAAARRADLSCHLVIAGQPPQQTPGLDLARAWGSSVSWTRTADRTSVDAALPTAAAELAARGRRPYVVPRGGATALGAVGYVLAAGELHDQLAERSLRPACVVVAVGSGCTLAGLVAGNALLGWPWRLVGASVSRPPHEASRRVLELARECILLLAAAGQASRSLAERTAETVTDCRIKLVDARGPGHGLASAAGNQAADAALRTEGLAIDPVYTAKALPVLRAAGERKAVFWHTGGLLDIIAAATGEHR